MVATGGHGDGSDARGGGNGSTDGSAGCGCINGWSWDGYPWDDELDEYQVDDDGGDRSSDWSEDDKICPDDSDGGCCCAAGKSVDLITWFGGAEEEEEDTFPDLALAEGKFKPWILFKLFMLSMLLSPDDDCTIWLDGTGKNKKELVSFLFKELVIAEAVKKSPSVIQIRQQARTTSNGNPTRSYLWFIIIKKTTSLSLWLRLKYIWSVIKLHQVFDVVD
jgi:hypothetical protein